MRCQPGPPAGKGVWGKGYTELLDLLHEQRDRGEPSKSLDVYGSGEDIPEVTCIPTQPKACSSRLGRASNVLPSCHACSAKGQRQGQCSQQLCWLCCACTELGQFCYSYLNPSSYLCPDVLHACLSWPQACRLAAHDTKRVGMACV